MTTTQSAPPDNRPQPPESGDERALLEGMLEFHRATLLWKCAGLTDAQLRTKAVPTSDLTLLGLVRHITDVERGWFFDYLPYEATPIYFSEERNNDDFDAVDSVPVADVFARLQSEVDRIRTEIAAVPLDQEFTDKRGKVYSLRWVYLHMIEEYCRHNGHADMIREAIDGVTGE